VVNRCCVKKFGGMKQFAAVLWTAFSQNYFGLDRWVRIFLVDRHAHSKIGLMDRCDVSVIFGRQVHEKNHQSNLTVTGEAFYFY